VRLTDPAEAKGPKNFQAFSELLDVLQVTGIHDPLR